MVRRSLSKPLDFRRRVAVAKVLISAPARNSRACSRFADFHIASGFGRVSLKKVHFCCIWTGKLQRCKLFPFIQFRLRCEKGGCLARLFSFFRLGCHTSNSLDGNVRNAGYRRSRLGCVAGSASASASAFSIVQRTSFSIECHRASDDDKRRHNHDRTNAE